MDNISAYQLHSALAEAASEIIEAEPLLTEIDTVIGDGDHGSGMKTGFSALKQMLENKSFDNPYDLLHQSGLCLIKTMGGASGVLFGTLFTGGLDTIAGLQNLNAGQLFQYISNGVAAIQRRGRAKPGDKTMVDALIAAVEEMEAQLAKSNRMKDLLQAAYEGAVKGAESTKSMVSRIGRSKNFREKTIGWPDPGAVSVSILFHGLYHGYSRLIEGGLSHGT